MRKLLILDCIGFIIDISGYVFGYFRGELWGLMISLVGAVIMLTSSIGITIKLHREKREKKK
ncbi:MAG: hypothetical protein HFI69_05910 [Lachnospiraceae bacterium]|nr:hypothetical protein [Lachnospiraceae bacterium]